jgi:hypothetical protein
MKTMKAWLAKFRISTALDSDTPQPEKLPGAESEREDIRRCEESMQSLDRQLKAPQPTKPVPAALHASVMRAVCAAAKSQKRQSTPAVLRWLPAPALALLAVFGLWWFLNRSPHEPQSLMAATAALEQSHELTQKAPAAVLAPLSQEMEHLNRDFQSAVEFLMASVP